MTKPKRKWKRKLRVCGGIDPYKIGLGAWFERWPPYYDKYPNTYEFFLCLGPFYVGLVLDWSYSND